MDVGLGVFWVAGRVANSGQRKGCSVDLHFSPMSSHMTRELDYTTSCLFIHHTKCRTEDYLVHY